MSNDRGYDDDTDDGTDDGSANARDALFDFFHHHSPIDLSKLDSGIYIAFKQLDFN